MPRRVRLDAPGCVHHVIQRGVERRVTFVDDSDRHDFLRRLDAVLPDEGVRCLAWVLMPNHFHLVLQTGTRPLWKALHRIGTGYSMRFNRRHERVGHLVQNRFWSRNARDDADVKNLIRYVHRNPLRAGLVRSIHELARHPWCGHAALAGTRPSRRFHSVDAALAYFGATDLEQQEELRAWMVEPVDQDEGHGAAVSLGTEAQRYERLLRERSRLCRSHGVAVADLIHGSRSPFVTHVRHSLATLAVRDLRLPLRLVAEAVGMSSSAVSRVARSARP